MIRTIKSFLLTREPFRPMRMGKWIRFFYFRHYLKKKTDLEKVHNVLDAGCGGGLYSDYLAGILPKCNVVGVDIQKQPEWNGYQKPNLTFRQMDLNLLEEKNKYDLIVSVDSLEHIPNNKNILEKFHSVLKSGGYLYLHIPCEATEKFLFPRSWFGEIDEWAETEHIGEQYSLSELKDILNSLGFKILLARHTFTFWGHLAWELETILRLKNKKWADRINIVLMPAYKLLGILDLFLSIGKGNNLVIAQKH